MASGILCLLCFWSIALERLNELSSFLKQHLLIDQDNYTAPASLMLGFTHWKQHFLERAPQLFLTRQQQSAEQERIAELERLVGQLTME